jgi:hypothetical protein
MRRDKIKFVIETGLLWRVKLVFIKGLVWVNLVFAALEDKLFQLNSTHNSFDKM